MKPTRSTGSERSAGGAMEVVGVVVARRGIVSGLISSLKFGILDARPPPVVVNAKAGEEGGWANHSARVGEAKTKHSWLMELEHDSASSKIPSLYKVQAYQWPGTVTRASSWNFLNVPCLVERKPLSTFLGALASRKSCLPDLILRVWPVYSVVILLCVARLCVHSTSTGKHGLLLLCVFCYHTLLHRYTVVYQTAHYTTSLRGHAARNPARRSRLATSPWVIIRSRIYLHIPAQFLSLLLLFCLCFCLRFLPQPSENPVPLARKNHPTICRGTCHATLTPPINPIIPFAASQRHAGYSDTASDPSTYYGTTSVRRVGMPVS